MRMPVPAWSSTFDESTTEPEWALGYHWDIVLTGASSTPLEAEHG